MESALWDVWWGKSPPTRLFICVGTFHGTSLQQINTPLPPRSSKVVRCYNEKNEKKGCVACGTRTQKAVVVE